MMRKLLSIFLIYAILFPYVAVATTYFYAASSQGSGAGTSCGNAIIWSDATIGFNTATAQAAGNTLTLCDSGGAYTFTANTQPLDVTHSGTSGSVITVATSGSPTLQSAYFSNGGALRFDTVSWIMANLGNLTIKNTANGTGLANQQPSTGIGCNACSNVTIDGQGTAVIDNICVVTSGDGVGCNQFGSNDQCAGAVGGLTNVTFKGFTLGNCQTGFIYPVTGGDSNLTLDHLTIHNTNWGVGVAGSGSMSGLTITNNRVYCVIGSQCNWFDASNNFHNNGIHIFPSSGIISSIVVANNWFSDISGHVTGYVFFDQNGATYSSPQVYNNLFTSNAGLLDGDIPMGNAAVTPLIVNNTFSNDDSCPTGPSSGTFENNIVVGLFSGACLPSTITTLTQDRDDFFALTGGTSSYTINGSQFSTLAAFTSASTTICSPSGCDANGSTTNPNLNSNFTLPSGSTLIGKNLTSLGIAGLLIGAPLNFGAGGSCGAGCVSRSAGGNDSTWIGAYALAIPISGGGSSISGGVKLSGGAVIK